MMRRDLAGAAGRAAFVAICALTGLYGVFAYVPFTFTQVIQTRLFEPFSRFIDWHSAFAWAGLAALAFGERRHLRAVLPGAVALMTVAAAAAIACTVRPLARFQSGGPAALGAGAIGIVLIIWLAGVEAHAVWFRVKWAPRRPDTDDSGRLFAAAILAALFSWALFAVTTIVRGAAAPIREELIWSLLAHLVTFTGAFVAAAVVTGLAGTGDGAARRECAIWWLALTAVVAALIDRVVFAGIAFGGVAAWAIAALFAAAITACWASMALASRAATPRPVESGADLFFAPRGRRSLRLTALRLIVLAVIAVALTTRAAVMDWNYLAQKLIAFAVWAAALSTMYATLPAIRRVGATSLLAVACLAPIGFGVVEARRDRATADRLAGVNPSFRLVRDAIVPAAGSHSELFAFLGKRTNIAREQEVDPVDVNFVDGLAASAGDKPHVFMFVVDSLRRDYVGAFNPAATFTPRIDAFAKESVAFTNAFTRYGATGLSEPSIWAGSMLVHKQYVTPFGPMNTLEKLLAAERYRQVVSMDSILKVILTPDPGRRELDAGIATKDYDGCRSLVELGQMLRDEGEAARPLFAYTQPQNLHISSITREGATAPEGESYPGFYAPYASRLKRLDGCFGAFIDTLKEIGLYDHSIVVFTADHGDSLGEDGRFGHAYTIFPEILRIPLIVHVPRPLAEAFTPARDSLVFSTDIAPTMYALLGHAPTAAAFPLGRPLFVPKGAPIAARSGDELVASSYGTVYGLIQQAGQRLYIVDAVNFQDYVYDLRAGLIGRRDADPSDAERAKNQQTIRDQLDAIDRFYRFEPSSR